MTEWFEEWFGEEYLQLYPHRNDAEAARLLALIRRTLPWQPGWRVLDVACGAGRHLAAVEVLGARAIGLDLSPSLLKRARTASRSPLIRADMRHLPVRPGSMDLTLNLFTSFGYFATDAEHRSALAGMLETVRPGGWFVIDFLNADAVRTGLVPAERANLGGAEVQVSRRLIGEGRFVIKTIQIPDGRQFTERVRLFEAPELEAMIEAAGLAIIHRFGDYDGGPLGPGPRTLLIGQRA